MASVFDGAWAEAALARTAAPVGPSRRPKSTTSQHRLSLGSDAGAPGLLVSSGKPRRRSTTGMGVPASRGPAAGGSLHDFLASNFGEDLSALLDPGELLVAQAAAAAAWRVDGHGNQDSGLQEGKGPEDPGEERARSGRVSAPSLPSTPVDTGRKVSYPNTKPGSAPPRRCTDAAAAAGKRNSVGGAAPRGMVTPLRPSSVCSLASVDAGDEGSGATGPLSQLREVRFSIGSASTLGLRGLQGLRTSRWVLPAPNTPPPPPTPETTNKVDQHSRHLLRPLWEFAHARGRARTIFCVLLVMKRMSRAAQGRCGAVQGGG
jgi:hypothetical protein